MGRQELLEYLLREIEKCGFEIFAVDILPIPAAVNVDKKLMIYNFKEASPFEIAHELCQGPSKNVGFGSLKM
ncbi:hypothetical protein LLT7_11905 [Lactococcus cremoris subsp. cremoris TIFN7]|nr:hypothetical protein LLT7_11905 [Lactococcus cremoris subsp. cremoris TIFN7]